MAVNTKDTRYLSRNVIVGAAALYVSEADSTTTGVGATYWQQTASGPFYVPAPSGVRAATGDAAAILDADANWRSVGYTTDGIEASMEPDFGEVTVDQALDSVKMFKQGMRFSVRTTLAEATLENLMLAWGQKNSTKSQVTAGVTELAIATGDLGDDPVERSLAFVGKAPRGASNVEQERVYHVRRALQVESSATSQSRADAQTIPVSFRCMPEGTVNGTSAYGSVIERTKS